MKEKIEQLEEEGITESDRHKVIEMLSVSDNYILCTNKGIVSSGTILDYMNIITHMVTALKEEMPEECIKFAVENGLTDINDEKQVSNLMKFGVEILANREKGNE